MIPIPRAFEQGRHQAIREILCQAFRCGPGDTRTVELRRVAADDMGDGSAALLQVDVQPVGDGADMPVEAAPGQKAGGEKGLQNPADRLETAKNCQEQTEGDGTERADQQEDAALPQAERLRVGIAIENLLCPGDGPAHGCNRVRNPAVKPIGIAKGTIQQKRKQDDCRDDLKVAKIREISPEHGREFGEKVPPGQSPQRAGAVERKGWS